MGPDNIRSQQRNPKNFLLDFSQSMLLITSPIPQLTHLDAWFDFLANVPESQHAGLMLFSDHATPDGNHFSAYGCHTFRWVNAEGQATFVKVSISAKSCYQSA
jgi:catalase